MLQSYQSWHSHCLHLSMWSQVIPLEPSVLAQQLQHWAKNAANWKVSRQVVCNSSLQGSPLGKAHESFANAPPEQVAELRAQQAGKIQSCLNLLHLVSVCLSAPRTKVGWSFTVPRRGIRFKVCSLVLFFSIWHWYALTPSRKSQRLSIISNSSPAASSASTDLVFMHMLDMYGYVRYCLMLPRFWTTSPETFPSMPA